jgi:hypothetical protein
MLCSDFNKSQDKVYDERNPIEDSADSTPRAHALDHHGKTLTFGRRFEPEMSISI